MVYLGGKPSTGCERCRARKIKCDRTAGGCINCEKRGYEFSGYRSEVDLKFRDESQQVARKSKDREAAKMEASASRSSLPGSSGASSASAEPSRRPSAVVKSSRISRTSMARGGIRVGGGFGKEVCCNE
ncbi:uncharacterized protein PAC_08999 [Phialocephala subalpina]|uniref:Zn(2)-C6 fungal-type domain-containing protein n=1 Tax=Phialocephala subalpina TaxID=576137 RepID=A0A1L7X274_9HELO|nr:uncharacterized protein PAC_08999 [Phialocephala subalpina]